MLLWLNGSDNSKYSPNENYGREMMELFTLGADRGYTESDVRQQARALTGFRNSWSQNSGPDNFRYDPRYHDPGVKTIFHHRGRFTWKDSCRLCVTHPDHPSFFVQKLWSYFVPEPPDHATQRALERLYKTSRYEVRPVVAAILRHPALYQGPRLVKPPVVYNAGLLRRLKRGIDTTAWTWLDSMAGQQLFYPPNVGGWDDTRWLDTATWRGRWWIAQYVLDRQALDPDHAHQPYDARSFSTARRFWHDPPLGETPARAPHVRAPGARRRQERRLEAQAVPGDGAERAPPPDRRLTGAAGRMTGPCNHCDGLSRSRLLHRALAEAGRGLPAIEPGMPLPAGTGLTRRRSSRTAPAPRSPSTAARRSASRAFEEGIAAAASGPAAASPRFRLPRGRRRRPVRALTAGRPALQEAGPQLALAGGTQVRRGRPPLLASGARWASAALLGEEGDRVARRWLHPCRPVALHLPPLLGGRSDGGDPAHRLARAVPRQVGRRTTRSRDSRSTTRSPLPWRRPRFRSRRSQAPTSTTSTASESGARSSSGCSRRSA